MQRIQHQIFNTGRLFCDFEVFLVKESVTIKIKRYYAMTKHFIQIKTLHGSN